MRGLAHQREERRRQLDVDLLVGADVAVPEVEEGLPVDEPARGPCAAPQVIRIVRLGEAGSKMIAKNCFDGSLASVPKFAR